MKRLKTYFNNIKRIFGEFNDADPFTYSAAIAFYTMLSLPSILFLIVQGLGALLGEEAVTGQLYKQIDQVIGMDAAKTAEELIRQVEREPSNWWTTALNLAAVLVGSTTVFIAIQNGLNQIWRVKAKPSAGIIKLILDRLFSFTIVLSLGFLLIVSLSLDAALGVLNDYLEARFANITVIIAWVINFLLSMGIMSVLFGLLFRTLPDAKITWKSAWLGGLSTTVFFILGKLGIEYYLASSDLGTSYGAAGSLVLLLVWVYYSSLIVLFGGKLTQLIVVHRKGRVQPSSNAIRFETRELTIQKGEEVA